MEELKLLVGMVAELPETAVWALVLFFIYKTFIIGSIWGVIRAAIKAVEFGLQKAHDVKTKPREIIEKVDLGEFCITGNEDKLKRVLRLAAAESPSSFGRWLNESDTDWIAKAINEKIQRDAQEKYENESN
jgi:hypothetical protein